MQINNPYKILNAWFVPTGTAPDMAATNLVTSVGLDTLTQFDFKTQGGSMTTPENLAGLAGNILISDPNGERIVGIPNGWGERRLRFILRLGIPGQQNGILYYYTGYTDYDGWSSGVKNFDPNMRLYINNVIQVSNSKRLTPQGEVPFVVVNECSHLFHPLNLASGGTSFQTQFQPNGMGVISQPTTLRPCDLMTTLGTQAKNVELSANGMLGGGIIDSRPSIDLVKSKRANAIPSQYLSNAVEALYQGTMNAAEIPNASPSVRFDSAAGSLTEVNAFSDRFLNPFITEFGLQANGFFTWSQLESLHPELHATGVTTVGGKSQMLQHDMYLAQGGNYDTMIGDRRPQTVLWNRIMSILPGILLTKLLVFARIHVTNMTSDGSTAVFITDPLSFVDIPNGYLIERIPYLQQVLKQQVFDDLGLNTYVPYDIYLTIDVLGESFGEITYNGEFAIPYTGATYADSLTSDMVSQSGLVLPKIASDINYITSSVC